MKTNITHSIQARLLNLSKKTGVGYQQIITRYFQERLLSRLSRSDYRGNFILKGGALLYAHSGDAARPTLDLDFMGERISREKNYLTQVFKEIYGMQDSDGVEFIEETLSTKDIAVDKIYPGVRIGVLAKLGNIRQVVSMDIGFGDIVVPSPVTIDYPSMLVDSDISILAYSIETVIAEKIQTMVDRYLTNSRMKDFFDVWLLLNKNIIDRDILKESINSTFINRGTDLYKIRNIFNNDFYDDPSMSLRWKAFSKKLKRDLPIFSEIMKDIYARIKYLID